MSELMVSIPASLAQRAAGALRERALVEDNWPEQSDRYSEIAKDLDRATEASMEADK